ncbi:DEAD/DEAH box helicase [Tsukamurella sp. 1534]|uniref:DEAD/DEAH box helicase n=1 Tax=Tsukamurella sp. 1534 TaxID=1151061 RepID=UPI00031B624C|nr:DEAD/DEAH box helicase [Tsukamurella sp. 1534]
MAIFSVLCILFEYSVQRILNRIGPKDTPLSLEVTYLSDLHQFALWSSHDLDTPARTTAVPLAVPVDGALAVRDVRCDVVDITALPAAARPSASHAAWAERVSSPGADGPLPIAAHAEPDPTATAVTSPEYAARAFSDAAALAGPLGDTIDGTLRPYQLAGVAWLLRAVEDHGGALLADEMGLGKTMQAVAALSLLDPGPHLVVCPTSLVTNWRREIARFAPALAGEITVISYARLRLSGAQLAEKRWGAVVFDEAHTLKNPRTQVSRAARELDARARIALTGTPIENTLDDLWSILRVVAPAMFPVRAVFRRRFTKAVAAGDDGALRRLRAAVAPVMLARTKERAAGALPPKIDNPVLCDLTDEQARAYDACLARAADDGFGTGVARHGRLLAVLTSLKQICNHPALPTGVPPAGEPGRSGKLDVAMEILEANIASDRPTLVFTQYRDTGALLARAASAAAGEEVPFFHGGLSTEERAAIADGFQSGEGPGVLVMSLKAGGAGLTLTRACDVLHFDRWWNPAVEAQATDRAHRIGQDRPVTVTTLTTATTLEEHIDGMHRRKALLGVHADDRSIVSELASLADDRLLDVLRRNREEA